MHTLLKNFHKKRQAMSFLGKSIIHFESAFSRIQILSLDTVSTLIKRHSIREARKKEIMLSRGYRGLRLQTIDIPKEQ